MTKELTELKFAHSYISNTLHSPKPKHIEILSALGLSMVVNGGVLRHPLWRRLMSEIVTGAPLELCQNTIWLPYTDYPALNERANMRNADKSEQFIEGRWYPDNISLALIVALNKLERPISITKPFSWNTVQQHSGASASFTQLGRAVRADWQRRADNTLTSSLVKVVTGEYPTAPLDHARHRVWITGSEEALPTRRFSHDDGELDEEREDDNVSNAAAKQELTQIKACFRKYRNEDALLNTRPHAARLVEQLLPQLTEPGRCIASWLSWKMTTGRRILVSSAQKYVVLLGEECYHLLDELARDASATLSELVNEQSSRLQQRLDELAGERFPEERLLCIRRLLNDLAAQHSEQEQNDKVFKGAAIAAKFVNAGLFNEFQLSKLLRARPGTLTPLEWSAWLELTRVQGMRDGEINLPRRIDGLFADDGTLDTHLHRQVKTRTSNRVITTSHQCTQLLYSMRSWLLSQKARLFMPIGDSSDKSKISQAINDAIKSVLIDEDLVGHILRHTDASEDFEDISIKYPTATEALEHALADLAAQLGHKNIGVTFGSYIHNSDALISQRLNAMTIPLSAKVMSSLTGIRFISRANNNSDQRSYQRNQLIEALSNLKAVRTHRRKPGRPPRNKSAIANATPILTALNVLTLPPGPALPFWEERRSWLNESLGTVYLRYPGLHKSNTALSLSKPRNVADAKIFEHILTNALIRLKDRPAGERELRKLISLYDVKITPNGFYCETTQEARLTIKWLNRLLPKGVKLSARVITTEHGGVYRSEWRRTVREPELNRNSAAKGQLLVQVLSEAEAKSSSGVLPALVLLALQTL